MEIKNDGWSKDTGKETDISRGSMPRTCGNFEVDHHLNSGNFMLSLASFRYAAWGESGFPLNFELPFEMACYCMTQRCIFDVCQTTDRRLLKLLTNA
jgi:hypothetical protein